MAKEVVCLVGCLLPGEVRRRNGNWTCPRFSVCGNVYIAGWTDGSLGGPNAGGFDAYLAKYDAAGSLLWTEQLGTGGRDIGLGVSADSLGNVYISGFTEGSLGGPNAGSADAFVAKFGVPEPSTLVLAALGFAALVARSWRRTG